MIIFFSFNHKTVKDFGSAGKQICSVCNNEVEMRKLKITTWFKLYFIPIIPYKKEYVLACGICKNCLPVSEDAVVYDEKDIYNGKTETQISYLKQMEEIRNSEK